MSLWTDVCVNETFESVGTKLDVIVDCQVPGTLN